MFQQWINIDDMPVSVQNRVEKQINDYNRQTLMVFLFFAALIFVGSVVFCFTGDFTPLLALIMNVIWNFIWVVIYMFRKMSTVRSNISVCEDIVDIYTAAKNYGKYYKPPCVKTQGGSEGRIYDNKTYSPGDRVYIVRCGISKAAIFCMAYEEI